MADPLELHEKNATALDHATQHSQPSQSQIDNEKQEDTQLNTPSSLDENNPSPDDVEQGYQLSRPPSDNALEALSTTLTRRGTINPDSPQFSTEKFLRMLITKAQEQGIKPRESGVCFRNLVVLGYGSGFANQNTVGSAATGILRIPNTIRNRRHPVTKTILYNMNGIVEKGEMLLVLGKPGSGATTLLKTLSGQTNGYAGVTGGTCSFKLLVSDG